MANRVRATLDKQKGISDLIFDTTGTGYFKAGKGFSPVAADLNEVLRKARLAAVKVTDLKEVDLPKTSGIYELTVAGVA